jgi:hypothetical protein
VHDGGRRTSPFHAPHRTAGACSVARTRATEPSACNPLAESPLDLRTNIPLLHLKRHVAEPARHLPRAPPAKISSSAACTGAFPPRRAAGRSGRRRGARARAAQRREDERAREAEAERAGFRAHVDSMRAQVGPATPACRGAVWSMCLPAYLPHCSYILLLLCRIRSGGNVTADDVVRPLRAQLAEATGDSARLERQLALLKEQLREVNGSSALEWLHPRERKRAAFRDEFVDSVAPTARGCPRSQSSALRRRAQVARARRRRSSSRGRARRRTTTSSARLPTSNRVRFSHPSISFCSSTHLSCYARINLFAPPPILPASDGPVRAPCADHARHRAQIPQKHHGQVPRVVGPHAPARARHRALHLARGDGAHRGWAGAPKHFGFLIVRNPVKSEREAWPPVLGGPAPWLHAANGPRGPRRASAVRRRLGWPRLAPASAALPPGAALTARAQAPARTARGVMSWFA